jgi:addiction module HigA family antidote
MWTSETTTEIEVPMSRTIRRRAPTRPGEILREEFLLPLGMTQRQLAEHIGCDVKVVNRIVNGRTSVSAEMALKLAAAFRTSAEFWMNAQLAVDLHRARDTVELPEALPRTG